MNYPDPNMFVDFDDVDSATVDDPPDSYRDVSAEESAEEIGDE